LTNLVGYCIILGLGGSAFKARGIAK